MFYKTVPSLVISPKSFSLVPMEFLMTVVLDKKSLLLKSLISTLIFDSKKKIPQYYSICMLFGIWYCGFSSTHPIFGPKITGQEQFVFEMYYHQTDYLLVFLPSAHSRNSEMKPICRMGQPESNRNWQKKCKTKPHLAVGFCQPKSHFKWHILSILTIPIHPPFFR